MDRLKRKPRQTLLSFDPLLNSPAKPSSDAGYSYQGDQDKENAQYEFFHGSKAGGGGEGVESKVNNSSSNILIDFDSPVKSTKTQDLASLEEEEDEECSALISWGDTPVKQQPGGGGGEGEGTGPSFNASSSSSSSFLDGPATPTAPSTISTPSSSIESGSPLPTGLESAASSSSPPLPNLPPPSSLSYDNDSSSSFSGSITPKKTIPTSTTITQSNSTPQPLSSSSPQFPETLLASASPAGSESSTTSSSSSFNFDRGGFSSSPLNATSPNKDILDESFSGMADSSFTLDLSSITEQIMKEEEEQQGQLNKLELNNPRPSLPSPASSPSRPAPTKATPRPLRIRALEASISSSSIMGINTPPRSAAGPSSSTPESPGGDADETLQLAFDADASFFDLMGSGGDDEQLLGEEGAPEGMDGLWDLEEMKAGAVWKGKGRKSEEKVEVVVEEASIPSETLEDEQQSLSSIAVPDKPAVPIIFQLEVSQPTEPAESSFDGMASTFNPAGDITSLFEQAPPLLSVDMTLAGGLSFNGAASTFHHLGDTTNLLEESSFVINEAADITFAPSAPFDGRASTFNLMAADTTILLHERPLSRLGDTTFSGLESFNGGKSIFPTLSNQSYLLAEEPEDDGDVTFVIEDSPKKAGYEEDESFGVFGGKITENEKVQRDAVLKKAADKLARLRSPAAQGLTLPTSTSRSEPAPPKASTSRISTPPTVASPLPSLPSLDSTPRRAPLTKRSSIASDLRAAPLNGTPRLSLTPRPSRAAEAIKPNSTTTCPPSSSRTRPTPSTHRRSLSLASPLPTSALTRSPSARTLNPAPPPATTAASSLAEIQTRPTPTRGHGRSSSTSSYRTQVPLASRVSSSNLAGASRALDVGVAGTETGLRRAESFRFGGAAKSSSEEAGLVPSIPTSSSSSRLGPSVIQGGSKEPSSSRTSGTGGAATEVASTRPLGIRPSSSSSSHIRATSSISSSLRPLPTNIALRMPSPSSSSNVPLPSSSTHSRTLSSTTIPPSQPTTSHPLPKPVTASSSAPTTTSTSGLGLPRPLGPPHVASTTSSSSRLPLPSTAGAPPTSRIPAPAKTGGGATSLADMRERLAKMRARK